MISILALEAMNFKSDGRVVGRATRLKKSQERVGYDEHINITEVSIASLCPPKPVCCGSEHNDL